MDLRTAVLQDSPDLGKALTGPLLDAYWRYRIGNIRAVRTIQGAVLCVLVVEIGSRKDVY